MTRLVADRGPAPAAATAGRAGPATLLAALTAGGSGPPSRTRRPRTAGGSDPDVKAAILACFADRTTAIVDGRAVRVPRPGGACRRSIPGRGSPDRARRHARSGPARTWRRASIVMPPSYVNVGAWVGAGHDGRLARPRRVVRPDRRARASCGGRDDRRRARAGRSTAGDRRGRRVRRRGHARSSRACSSAPARSSGRASS